ncbi:phosphatase PAP2 family protein [Miniphocaeibacter halophilus]|uniref:Phosphatase PAP2 family protein n=1 Tax=Miniphocaeibacter halophilus TaxID=2931922 RepID=A0AC61MQJ9_9FIRM|nr:phosphatase PAP2 family protein [Miniphocaeibacter halophilus]QQK07882.1 phosphatase PAP2 family protein [Miniphocaeibacter halophilus]
MNDNFILILTIAILVLVLLFGKILMKSKGFTIDLKVRAFFYKNATKQFKHMMNMITTLANVETILIISIPILFYLISEKMLDKATAIILSVFFSVGISQILKFLFRVSRPTKSQEFKYIGYSFPSGHSTVGMAYYLTLAYILAGGLDGYTEIVFIGLILGILIGFSRLVLGVHWFTDVTVGLILGLLCSWWVIKIYSTGYYINWLFN